MLSTLIWFVASMMAAFSAIVTSIYNKLRATVILIILSTLLGILGYKGGSYCYYWLKQLGLPMCIAVDGASVLLVLLSGIVSAAALVAARMLNEEREQLGLAITSIHFTMIGLAYAYSLPLFYIFWELMLLASSFLVYLWDKRIAIQFFIYMHAGSLLLLVAMGILASEKATIFGSSVLGTGYGLIAFSLILVAFAIKLGVFPFHTWLPRTYTSLPGSSAAVISGIVTSAGAYGLYRLLHGIKWLNLPQSVAFTGFWLGATSAIVGALAALLARRLGFIASYSSISHGGFMYAGLVSLSRLAAAGALYIMFAHGIVKPLFFLLASILAKQAGSDDIRDMGLYAKTMPLTAFIGFVTALSLAGAPVFALFPGEITVIIALAEAALNPIAVAILVTALFLAAAYALRYWLRVFWRPVVMVPRRLPSEPPRRLLLVPLTLAIIAIVAGVLPAPIFSLLGAMLP